MASLKPNEEIIAASFAVAAVYAIFSQNVPNLADVKAAQPGNSNVHKSVKQAVLTSAALVSGIALLAKSPIVFELGGLMIVIEGWKYYHANAVQPNTGAVVVPSQFGSPTQPGSDGNGPA
jgi:hypothetical protein